MKRSLILFFIFLFSFNLQAGQVLVSISPYKLMVEKIAGDTVNVTVIVPPTADMHTFEPTVKQTLLIGKADIWFRVGETFEKQLLDALGSYRPNLTIIDMREGLDLIQGGCCHHHASADLHFWLSPRMLKVQAKKVADALIAQYPEHRERYEQGLKAHLEELNQLESDVNTFLTPLKGTTILVSHPAYAYLARDYGFKQLSIETEGREPSPRELTSLLTKARQANSRLIFTQVQFNNKVAKLIANQLGAELIYLDPHAEDYLENLRMIARQFSRHPSR